MIPHTQLADRARKPGFASATVFMFMLLIMGACQGSGEQSPTIPTPTATKVPLEVVSTAADVEPTDTAVTQSSTPREMSSPVSPTATIAALPPSPAATQTPTPRVEPVSTPSSTGGSASGANPSPTPTRVFVPIPPEPDIPVPPDRDLQDLGRRLVAGYVEPQTILPSDPLVVGEKVGFFVSRDVGSVPVSGEVVHISEHAYWIFEDGFIPSSTDIEQVASDFETDVWPAVTAVFGTPLMPGIDGDDRIVVFNAVLRSGVAGYFSAADSYPREILSFSNQREALYMSANRVDLTGSEYLSVIAHELQHASHFANDTGEDSWVNEGLSEVAAEIAGFDRSAISSFVRAPSTSLTAWAQDIASANANYGAANLFFNFLATHYGGNEILRAVALNQEDGIDSIDSSLAERGFEQTANDVYADWLVANYLSTDSGPYGYDHTVLAPVRNIYKRAPDTLNGEVRGYGSDYWVTSSGSGQMTIEFAGEPNTPLLSSPPHSGETCWWANHGDSIDTTLTRTIDLTAVDSATLSYWTLYDIEEFWDYAYIMVSIDDGATWQILDTTRARTLDPNGTSYGAGLTGVSAGWVKDSVDLSSYAGQEVLLRFEYITDDAVFSRGICFDDFEIPEIEWFDNSSSRGDWVADGFALAPESVPTQYLVQVIHEKDVGDPIVYQLPVDASGSGLLTVEGIGEDDLLVIIVSAVTRHSTASTEYSLRIYP